MDSAIAFFSSHDTQLALTVAPIDSVVNHIPADLSAGPMYSDAMTTRFKALLRHVLERLDGVDILALSIGNEVAAYLGESEIAWNAYEAFFAEVAAHTKAVPPGMQVGVKMQYSGLVDDTVEQADAMNAHADAILATYYPLNADFTVRPPWQVDEDIGRLMALYPEKELMLLECGYPTAQLLNSSEELQQDFIGHTFDMWDHYSLWLKAICFRWLHDRPEEEIEWLTTYYGNDDERFVAFLSSLGLSYADGTSKLGLETLEGLAGVCGW